MKIAVLTSGGDAPGMNAAIRAVARAGNDAGYEVYGVKEGYKGLIEKNFVLLDRKFVSGMLAKGGTDLGTARLKEFENLETQNIAVENLKAMGIEGLVVIGGDGTYRGAYALSKLGIKTVGIPGTIDNDIFGTDFTIGFQTAVETIVDALDKLRDTSQSHRRCSIVEVMGRYSGDLALYSGICGGAEFIITPENPIDKEHIIERLKAYLHEERRHAIIVITEKIMDVHQLAKEITEASGFASRATVLGYIQRGGKPCAEDRILGSRMGAYAIDLLKDDIHGVAIGVRDSRMVHLPFVHVIDHKKGKNELYDIVKRIS